MHIDLKHLEDPLPFIFILYCFFVMIGVNNWDLMVNRWAMFKDS